MNWSKFLSREFLYALALSVVATVALFVERASFVEWSVAVGGFVTIWNVALTTQKVKGATTPKKE